MMIERPWMLDLLQAFGMGLIGYLVLSQFLVSHQKDLVRLQGEQEILQESIAIRRALDCRQPCTARWGRQFPNYTFQCGDQGLVVTRLGSDFASLLLCPRVMTGGDIAHSRGKSCPEGAQLVGLDFMAQKVSCTAANSH
jgi:hypothetical protein